jgi:murein DD-endopeptidase MepM/ murein hydrolase activator NlpD
MKFTLLFRSKRVRFAKHISARTLVSSMVLASLLLIISSRSTENLDESLAIVSYVTTGLLAEQGKVKQVHQQAIEQLSIVKSQLASMEARLREIDVLSQSIAEQAGIEYPKQPEMSSLLEMREDTDATHPLLIEIKQLDDNLSDKVKQLQALESVLLGHHIQDVSEVAGKPVSSGWLSSYYGVRKDPFSGKAAMHKGLDFAGKEGDPVIATGAGLITWAGERSGYGYLVEIDHGNGLVSRYGHNAELDVQMGDLVTKGQIIASMGSTGRSTGAHVHYEVLRDGKPIDPLPFVY